MKIHELENKKRLRIVIVAAIVFILAVSVVFLSIISITTLADVNTSVSNVREFGYSMYYYNGEEVGHYQFQSILENTLYDDFFDSESYDEARDAYYDAESDSYLSFEEYLAIHSRSLIKELGAYKPISNTSEIDIPDGFVVLDVVPQVDFDEAKYDRYMGILWIILMASTVVSSISIVLVFLFCGQKDDQGNIKLIWADKVLGEIQLLLGFGVALLLLPVVNLFNHWLTGSDWGKSKLIDLFPKSTWADINPWLSYWFSSSYDKSYFEALFQPAWVILVLAIILTLATASFELFIATSLVKKIKARCFWKNTFIGSIFYWCNEHLKDSKNISIKIIGSLLASIAFWTATTILLFRHYSSYTPYEMILFIAAAFVVLTMLLVPKQIRKYNMVKHGLSEVQKGNFSYKVSGVGNGELGRLADMVNSITEAQSDAMNNELKGQRLKTELISNVSHDLRTPLTSMVSYIDLLKTEGLDSENAAEYLNILSEKTDRLQKLTEDLFEAAKASSGDLPINIEAIDLDAMVNQAIAELEENISQNNIELIYTNRVDNPLVSADGNLLWRIIDNLLVNIGKYAMPRSRAYVDIVDKGKRIALEVKNISSYSLNITAEELMERFKRGDGSRNTEGSGLGLAIVNDLTNLMDGHFYLYVDGDLFKATVELPKPVA